MIVIVNSNTPATTMRALSDLVTETRRAFHRLARAADRLHQHEGATAAERAILVELAQEGPRTVPQMAKARPVSRQHVQTIVNALLERGLVEGALNPQHRRSGLVVLTPSGRDLVGRLLETEAAVLADLSNGFTSAQLEQARRTLRRVVDAFDGPAFRSRLESAQRREPTHVQQHKRKRTSDARPTHR
jgi:DNA-binding MarR family transcriptional regulator